MSVETVTKPKHVYEVYIRATPERIWEAMTKPEFTSLYFYGSHVDPNMQVNEPYMSRSGDGTPMVDGTVLEYDPPRRLVHTWHCLYDPEQATDAPSRVTWEIEPSDEGYCKLSVVHDEFEGETATYRGTSGGWSYILSGLKTLVETGEPLTS
jgi:uncharacterized protein YndB with AHSA1/START domain